MPNAPMTNWSSDDLIRQIRETIAKGYNETNADGFAAVDRAMQRGEVKSTLSNLESVGTFYGLQGAAAVASGDIAGWETIRNGWCYGHLWYRFRTALVDREIIQSGSPQTTIQIYRFHVQFPMALLFGELEAARWCGQRLMRDFTKGDPVAKEKIWYETPLQPWLARLYAKWAGCEEEFLSKAEPAALKAMKKAKGFQQALDSWDQPAFDAALASACDEFGALAAEDGRSLLYQAVPAELLALLAIRAELGLPATKVEHPVLDQPLARVPAKIAKPKSDKLLDRVVARVRELEQDLPLVVVR